MPTIFNATLYKIDEHQIVVIDGAEYLLVESASAFQRRSLLNYKKLAVIQQNSNKVKDIVLGTKEEAELVLQNLRNVLDKYDRVSLADLYDLVGLATTHFDNKQGWTSLGVVEVRQIRDGWILDLPVLEELP
jgi:hypothetical protein